MAISLPDPLAVTAARVDAATGGMLNAVAATAPFPMAAGALDVVCSGSGDTTIVAIHGIQGTRTSWQPLADGLHSNLRWVLPNLRGRAGAARGAGRDDYTLEKFADDIVAVIAQHVHTPHYILAGWSMGVSVALATVARLQQLQQMQAPRGDHVPALPRALILMSGSPVLQQTAWFHARRHADLIEEIAARELRLGLRQAADRDAVAWTWQAIGGTDQRPLLPTIAMPTLIVHGSADEDSPHAHAQLLQQALPSARLRTIDGGMHSILTQNTARVADAIRTFVADLGPFVTTTAASTNATYPATTERP